MSLIVHPAPRIMMEPTPNKANMWKSGIEPGVAAMAILHVHGRYSSQLPIGLSNLTSRKYGCTLLGKELVMAVLNGLVYINELEVKLLFGKLMLFLEKLLKHDACKPVPPAMREFLRIVYCPGSGSPDKKQVSPWPLHANDNIGDEGRSATNASSLVSNFSDDTKGQEHNSADVTLFLVFQLDEIGTVFVGLGELDSPIR